MRLYVKIVLLIVSINIGIGLVVSVTVGRVMKDIMENEMKERGILIAKMAAENVADRIFTNDVVFVSEYLKNITVRMRGIEYVYVKDFNNRIFAYSFEGGFPRALVNGRGEYRQSNAGAYEMRRYRFGDRFIFEFTYPIIEGTQADIHIGIDQSGMLSRIVALRKQIARITFVTAGLGAVIGIVISYCMTYPLSKLAKHMKTFDVEAPPEIDIKPIGSREVMELVNSFNAMRAGVIEAREKCYYYIGELEQNNKTLQDALAEIKTLRGLISICSSCKKVRDDKGFWTQVEAYVSEHTEAEFSHGICPDCMKKLYPEYTNEDTEDT